MSLVNKNVLRTRSSHSAIKNTNKNFIFDKHTTNKHHKTPTNTRNPQRAHSAYIIIVTNTPQVLSLQFIQWVTERKDVFTEPTKGHTELSCTRNR